ncbi:S49 family peptidase [Candidatus Bathyarchaeota archaeon]|nr:S49 family peptidase [Candidatus Bathyarchaeota archaeon]
MGIAMGSEGSGLRNRILVAVFLISLLIGFGLGFLSYRITLRLQKEYVGIINIEGVIESSSHVQRYVDLINRAYLNKSVKAVVLRIDCPGGYADLVEALYMDLLELKKEKPLIASIVFAASGGYYIAVAAEYLYAEPTSFIGNVGVIGIAPATLIPSERVLETGAYKATGFSRLLFPFNLTKALENFVSAVRNGRGARLKIDDSELRKGLLYLGGEALRIGLVDELGSLQAAIKKAAEKAGLTRYEAVSLDGASALVAYGLQDSSNQTSTKAKEREKAWQDLTLEALNKAHPPPSIWYIYLPPEALQKASYASTSEKNETAKVFGGGEARGRGLLLVDRSHGNMVSFWELDILIAELAKRNVTITFVPTWMELENALKEATALLVACPTRSYSPAEVDKLEAFVDRGGILLLIFDPAYEYLALAELFAPINSLATRFGLAFAKGYLYNDKDGGHFGFYRNIYVRSFANSSITKDLKSLVFFTATHVYSMDKGIAWTSDDTYSSTAERKGRYAIMAQVQRNGTVIALGDLTFLMEPYCYVEDNYKLLLNLVSFITSARLPQVEGGKEEKPVVEELEAPSLPVGTVKDFVEWVDGTEGFLRWIKVSDFEVRVERPDRTTLYFYNENGSLVKWTSDGMEAVYESPLPGPPFPLVKGKEWAYKSAYNLTIDGEFFHGWLEGYEWVEVFEEVNALDGKAYYCAKVGYRFKDQLLSLRNSQNITISTEGSYWISSDAGTVKETEKTWYYVNGVFRGLERRDLLLRSIKKG